VRFISCVLMSCLAIGCGARRPFNVTPDRAPAAGAAGTAVSRPPADSLETFMAKVRQLSVDARPERPAATTIEGADPRLAAALATAVMVPAPETYRAVADEYRRLRIADKAHQYLGKALALDPRDAATHDAIARVWRDSGFPQLALGDAYRALHFAPASPILHNTLGTIFQALGRRQLARARYERALQLDPAAAYALSNLCYGWVLEGRAERAIAACQHALRLSPSVTAARNNLGLAYAVAGDMQAARDAFRASGDAAATLYNVGIIHLARRDYGAALKAFEAAQVARPGMPLALARARQAQMLQKQSEE
jgi:Flp pilus assembly protein TadD